MTKPIETVDTTLFDLLSDQNTQLRIPIYQRPYTWGKKGDRSCKKKLTDFIDLVLDLSDKQDREAFCGFLVTLPEGRVGLRRRNYLNVIDGQQRLTTISLLYIKLCHSLQRLNEDPALSQTDKEENEKFLTDIMEGSLVFPNVSKTDVDGMLRLRSGDLDRPSYLQLLGSRWNQVPQGEDSICNGYRLISSRLDKHFEDKLLFCDIESVYNATKRLHIATLAIQDSSLGVNNIFESINFKGEKLSDFDLIRNFVVEYYVGGPAVAEAMYKQRWEKFESKYKAVFGPEDYEAELSNAIFAYLKSLPVEVSKSEIYESFKARFKNGGNYQVTSRDIDNIAEGLATYQVIMRPNVDPATVWTGLLEDQVLSKLTLTSNEKKALEVFSLLRLSVPLPFMMNVIKSPKSAVKSEAIHKAARAVEAFFVRHDLSGGATKSLAEPFNALTAAYCVWDGKDAEGAPQHIDKWFKINLLKKNRKKELIPMFATSEQVERYLSDANVYEDNYDVLKYVLYALNGAGGAEPPAGNHEIDHVMPQTLNKEWTTYIARHHGQARDYMKYLNKLGNLTLVTEKMNIAASNDTYEERKKFYALSGFVRTRELALDSKWKVWSFDVVKLRQKQLIEDICNLFP